jgi:hypothetical protein
VKTLTVEEKGSGNGRVVFVFERLPGQEYNGRKAAEEFILPGEVSPWEKTARRGRKDVIANACKEDRSHRYSSGEPR